MGLLTNRLKRRRFRMVAPYIRGDVLDVGCGPAEALTGSADKITSYVGIEFSQNRVNRNAKQFPQYTFLRKDLDEDALDLGRSFDVILLIAVIEHIYNQKHLMKQLVALLKPAGRIIITTPTPFGNDIVHRWGAGLGLFSKEAADDHVVIYNRRRLEKLARDFGLRLHTYRRFQWGCNQLAVLERTGAHKDSP